MNKSTIEKYLDEIGITPGEWHSNTAIMGVFSDKRTDFYGDGRDDLFICWLDPREYGNNQTEKNMRANISVLEMARKMLVGLIALIYSLDESTGNSQCHKESPLWFALQAVQSATGKQWDEIKLRLEEIEDEKAG